MRLVDNLKLEIEHRVALIRSQLVDINDQLILVRSLLEDWAVINFILVGPRSRLELFKCYNEFEWRTHFIFGRPSAQNDYFKLLLNLSKWYPYGFRKYYRLIKKRAIKYLKARNKPFKSELAVLTSVKYKDRSRQFWLVSRYMTNHLITKLPFPYRIVFGKSITFFVLRYTSISKGDYWLLADLSHGIIFDNYKDQDFLKQLVTKVIRRVVFDLNLSRFEA